MRLPPTFYRVAIAAASTLSGGVALYLHRAKLRPPEPVDPFSTCLVEGGCATVQNSAYGWFLGYDVALIGAVGYTAILVVSLFGLRREWRMRREPTLALMGLIYPAVLFTAWLKYAEFIVLRAFCPWCGLDCHHSPLRRPRDPRLAKTQRYRSRRSPGSGRYDRTRRGQPTIVRKPRQARNLHGSRGSWRHPRRL